MIFTPPLDPRVQRAEPQQSPGGTAVSSSRWQGHDAALAIPSEAVSHVDSQRVRFFTAPRSPSYQPRLTTHGLIGQSLVNDGGALMRTGLGLPVESWTHSPLYPDAPNSPSFAVLGYTTASHAPLGALAFYRSAQGVRRASDVGDRRGYNLGLIDLGKSVAKMGLGVGYAGLRTATIGGIVNPSNPTWGNLARSFGIAGNTGGGLFYAGLIASDMYAVDRNFIKKYKEKGGVEYMRRRLGFDQVALEEKALRGKTPEDLRAAGMEHLKAFAKTNMELLRKRGFDPAVQNEEEFIQTFLSDYEIEEAGRDALIAKLKAKKLDKMSRAIGEGSVRALSRLFSEDRPVEKEEVDKIVLSGLDKTNDWRYFRAGVYAVGIAAMICLCIFTSGLPLILACALYAAVALGEVIIALQILSQQKGMRDAAPGEYEKLIPGLGIGGTLAGVVVQLVLASVLSMGLLPLAVGLAVAVVYLALYVYHMSTVDQRRVDHGHYLMEEKTGDLTLEEFSYLCTYMPEKELLYNSPLERLNREDRAAIEQFMQDKEAHGKSWRDLLRYGLRRRQQQIEDEYVQQFWDRYQARVHLAAI